MRGHKRRGYFVNPDVLAECGHGVNGGGVPAVPRPAARLDYRAHFAGRSFRRPHVVKPSDCLVRYRYPFVCGLIDPTLFPIGS